MIAKIMPSETRNNGCRQEIEGGQKILDAFGQSVLEVGWPDPTHDGIGRSGVPAGEHIEVRHKAFLLKPPKHEYVRMWVRCRVTVARVFRGVTFRAKRDPA